VGRCLSDLKTLRDQPLLFGRVASDATAWRAMHQVDEQHLDALAGVRQQACRRPLEQVDEPVVLDIDASLVASASDDKQGAAANFKGGWGFHPMLCFIEPLGLAAGMLRPGNANANTIADQVAVLDQAIGSLPQVWQAGHRPGDDPAQVRRVLRVRADTAAHRRSCRAHRRRDRTLPEPGRPQLQHPPDRGRPVTPAGQHRRGQQHLRDPTAPAPAPPWTHPLSPAPSTHRALPCPPPGREGRLVTRRAHQRARLQFGLDADRIRAYRHHGCGLSQQEALPVSAKTCREGFARSGTHRHCPTRQPRSNPPLPARRPHPRRRPTPPRSSSHMAPDNTSDRLPSGVNPVRGRLMAEAR
jgi:hypothetical protein